MEREGLVAIAVTHIQQCAWPRAPKVSDEKVEAVVLGALVTDSVDVGIRVVFLKIRSQVISNKLACDNEEEEKQKRRKETS